MGGEGDMAAGRAAAARFGVWASAATAALAAVAFGIGATTPPRSGPFAAPGTAIPYPYSTAAAFVPRDFLWMYAAFLMMLAFVVMAACIRETHMTAGPLFGTVGLSLAIASFAIIAVDYAIQLRAVQPALVQHEGAAVVVLSQYNPHGVFIALEEIGFLLAAVAFVFLGLALGGTRLERITRWVLFLAASLTVLSFAGLSAYFGFDIGYRFEVASIAIVWITLAVVGVMLAFVFRGYARANATMR